jgi:hypothetical protein
MMSIEDGPKGYQISRTRRTGASAPSSVRGLDERSIAWVGIRMAGLRPVVDHEQLTVLRVHVERRPSRSRWSRCMP